MLFEFQNLLIVTKKSNKVQFQYIKQNQYRKDFFIHICDNQLESKF